MNSKKINNAICLLLCLVHFLTSSLAWAIRPPKPWSASSSEASDLSPENIERLKKQKKIETKAQKEKTPSWGERRRQQRKEQIEKEAIAAREWEATLKYAATESDTRFKRMIMALNEALEASQKVDQFDALAFVEKAKGILNENRKIEGSFDSQQYATLLEIYQRNYRKAMIVLGGELYRAAHGLPLSEVEIQNLPVDLPENAKAGYRDSAYFDSTKANDSERKGRLRRLESVQKLVSVVEWYSPAVSLKDSKSGATALFGVTWVVGSFFTVVPIAVVFIYWILMAGLRDTWGIDAIKAFSGILGGLAGYANLILQFRNVSAAPPRGMLPFYLSRILAEKRQRADFREALVEGYRAAGKVAGQSEDSLNTEIEIFRKNEGELRNQLLCESALTSELDSGPAIESSSGEQGGLSALVNQAPVVVSGTQGDVPPGLSGAAPSSGVRVVPVEASTTSNAEAWRDASAAAPAQAASLRLPGSESGTNSGQ